MLQLQKGCIEKLPKSHSNPLRHDRVLPEKLLGQIWPPVQIGLQVQN